MGAVVAAFSCAASVAAAEGTPNHRPSLAERWDKRKILPNPDEGRYVPILSGATFNETPSITTELRTFSLFNDVPKDFLTDKGEIHVLGLQARLAITDRIGVFVSEAGYGWAEFHEILPHADGPLNVSIGGKSILWTSPRKSRLITAGLRYELPSGEIESGQIELQGGGDGFLNPFLSLGAHSRRFGVQTSGGFNCALDGDHDSSAFHYGLHFDYELFDDLFAILESNLLTTISEGNRTPSEMLGSFEGYDLFNFGNDDSGTVMTAAAAARYRVNDRVLCGVGFEVPLYGRQDLVGFRLLFDVVVHL